MSQETIEYTGGCLCGNERFRALGKPIHVTQSQLRYLPPSWRSPFRDLGHFQESRFFIYQGRTIKV